MLLDLRSGLPLWSQHAASIDRWHWKAVCCSGSYKAIAGSGKRTMSHIDSCNKLVQGHQSIGSASYERSFGLKFIPEKDILADNDYGPEMRILPCRSKYGLRDGLAGKRVALVGNGEISDCGPLIDAHDEVIRITTMRAWQADPIHDGTRTTIWAGHPWIVVRRNPAGVLVPNAKFEQLLKEDIDIWAASPFHISVDSYRWLKTRGHYDDLLVTPAPMDVYEIACRKMTAEYLQTLFSISHQKENIIGFPYFDLMLTGTRLILLLELSGVKDISLFGFNLFDFSYENVWFGHDLHFDYNVINEAKKRIIDSGGNFYWHDEKHIHEKAISNKDILDVNIQAS